MRVESLVSRNLGLAPRFAVSSKVCQSQRRPLALRGAAHARAISASAGKPPPQACSLVGCTWPRHPGVAVRGHRSISRKAATHRSQPTRQVWRRTLRPRRLKANSRTRRSMKRLTSCGALGHSWPRLVDGCMFSFF